MIARSLNRKTYDKLLQLPDRNSDNFPWSGETRLYFFDGAEQIGGSVPFHREAEVVQERILVDLENDLYLHCQVNNQQVDKNEILAYLHGIVEGMMLFNDGGESILDAEQKKRSQNILFQANRQFHHSTHVREVLKVITDAMIEMMPDSDIELHLANDWGVTGISGITLLDLRHDEDNQATRVYVNGRKTYIQDEVSGKDQFYSPFPGRQGVYGVMKVSPRLDVRFHPTEIEFMETLSEIGGNAIESTNLYEQSRERVQDLQLIGETTKALNENLNIKEIFQLLRNKVTEAFGADEVLFLMTDERWKKDPEVVRSQCRQDLMEHLAIQTITEKIKSSKEEIFIAFWRDLDETAPYGSLIGIPMVHQQEVVGVVLVMADTSSRFSYDQFRLLQSLVQHSTMVFVNAMLHAEMQRVMVTDYLTGLNTREFMDREIRQAMNRDHRGVFLLFDVDDFKQVNDVYGHSVGDDVLIQVAEEIKNRLTVHDSIAVRWGGEELAVYVKNARRSDGEKLAELIRRDVEANTKPPVTVSCGVSDWALDGKHEPKLKDLFNQADHAMYKAKVTGKNTVIRYI